MGILDGIVDWLATQVMNLLDLASTSVLGALGCNMDTFKRYFPAASAMYEIFIWTAIGLVLLTLVWQLYRCYGAGFAIDTDHPINLVVRSVIFLLLIWYQCLQGHLPGQQEQQCYSRHIRPCHS